MPTKTKVAWGGYVPRAVILNGTTFPTGADTVNAIQRGRDWYQAKHFDAVIGCDLFFGRGSSKIGILEWRMSIGLAKVPVPASAVDNTQGGFVLKDTGAGALSLRDYGQDTSYQYPGSTQTNSQAFAGPGLWATHAEDDDTTGTQVPTVGAESKMLDTYTSWLPPGYCWLVNPNDIIELDCYAVWNNGAINFTGSDCQMIATIYVVDFESFRTRWGLDG